MSDVRCHFCGEPAAAGEDPRNALCEDHQAIHAHVVSMTRAGSRMAADCRCGWSYVGKLTVSKWPLAAAMDREEAVRAHWRSAVEEASAGPSNPTNRDEQE